MRFLVPALLQECQGVSNEGRAWLQALPEMVAELAARWSLQLGEPFRPGGQTAWVAPARDSAGSDLVLKVGRAHEEAEHEAEGLRAWQRRGAVGVHAAARLPGTVAAPLPGTVAAPLPGTVAAPLPGMVAAPLPGMVAAPLPGTIALLLERCRPGTQLGENVAEPEQDVVIARLLARLHEAPTTGPFRPLQEMCDLWRGGFLRRLAAAPPGALDPGLARDGAEVFTHLPGTAERHVLLCTDLHAGNVLASLREPWLVIDPKPYVGDPCYDVLQHALNCPERLVADPARLASRLADLAGLDTDRVRLWLFARCTIESLERPDLTAAARTLAP